MNLLKILGAIFAFAVLAVADAAETNWLGVGKTKIDAVEAMLSDANRGLSRPVSDRAFWERYPASSHIRRRAEQHRTGKVPELDATKPYDLPGNLLSVTRPNPAKPLWGAGRGPKRTRAGRDVLSAAYTPPVAQAATPPGKIKPARACWRK